jgi:very-short-patch-repair endonuclease
MNKITKISRSLRRNMTSSEKIFWTYIRDRKIDNHKIVRQHPIIFNYEDEKRFFIADFFCKKQNLIIEIDGSIHNTLKQKERDLYRDFLCKYLGYQVLRFTNDKIILDTESALEIFKKIMKENEFPSGALYKRKPSPGEKI